MDSFTAHDIVKLLLLLYFFVQLVLTGGSHVELVPVEKLQPEGLTEFQVVEAFSHHARRRLAAFQLCSLCKCRPAGSSTSCATMPCCYAIECLLPNKPFGTCAFVPKKCDCISCAA